MSYQPIIIRHLTFLSPIQPSATVLFNEGTNVIQGASDTGKSFIVSSIDFMLGANPPLKEIPQRIGYDTILLGLQSADGNEYTLKRSVQGGSFTCYEGLLLEPDEGKKLYSLASKHNAKKKENISRFLLGMTGLDERMLRTNKKGNTRMLSFRELSKLVVVQEAAIIKEGSPVETGQYMSKTFEYSLFKMMLTGIDDSSISPTGPSKEEEYKTKGRLEVMEQLLEEYEVDFENSIDTPEDLDEQLERIEQTIDKRRESVSLSERQFAELSKRRRNLWDISQENKDRFDEIGKLVERFQLLRDHYESDLQRLGAIKESGTLFVYQEQIPCPLCGTPPDSQPQCSACEHDVETVVRAASIEATKIQTLVVELDETVEDLHKEALMLEERMGVVNAAMKQLQNDIDTTIAPKLTEGREAYSDLLDKRSDLVAALKLLDKIQKLRKAILEHEEERPEEVESVGENIPKLILDEFSKLLEDYLKKWHFPETGRVYFSEETKDFVIASKPRSSTGKGLRAITHSAFTCGLIDYCAAKGIPHPGFVVIDSPLVAYKEPDGEQDDLSGSDLKDRFYRDLASREANQQYIVVENEEPPSDVVATINLIKFTKNPHEGRYGFFPVVSQSV